MFWNVLWKFKVLTFLHCFHGIYRYFGNSNAKFHILQCWSSFLWSFIKLGGFPYFGNFWCGIHGNIAVPMIAKIIPKQYIVGTYIVLKSKDFKVKHSQTIQLTPKFYFFTIFPFPWWWQPFFSSKVALQLESQGSLL